MSSWVSWWTPTFFAFAWAALNLTSASCSSAPSEALRLPLDGIGDRALGDFLAGSGRGFTELAFVGCGADATGFA
jgi:hypothetical protein